MKYCPKCGTKLDDSARFCTKCGYNFENSNPSKTIKSTSYVQNSSKFNQPVSINTQTKSTHWNALAIVVLVLLIVITGFTVWSHTASYRNAFTTDDEKATQLVKWNNKNDINFGTDISVDGTNIIMDPRDDSNFADYYHYYMYYGDDNSSDQELVDTLLKVSRHVTNMWGKQYTVKVLNPDNSDRYLMEAKDGQITYNIFD